MMEKLTILGGSSPFTAALVDALVQAKNIPPHSLVLHGRNQQNIKIVRKYAYLHLKPLGWSVEHTADISKALAGSHIVVHQVRYGGMTGRACDETIASDAGSPFDETLGPGALNAALRLTPYLDYLAEYLCRFCPEAWILNLTNPLSVVVFRLTQRGVRRCLGLCELPRVTVRQAATLLDEDPNRAQWSYIGLNHRGFIVGLSWNDHDRTIDLAHCLGDNTLGGVKSSDILSLGVLPTKYYRIYSHPRAMVKSQSRATFLSGLRKKILAQLRNNPRQSPSGLCERYMDWYPDAVVPMITALSSSIPTLQEVNVVTSNGLVEEGRVLVSQNEVGTFLPARVSSKADRWLKRFRRHERAVLLAIEKPSLENIIHALKQDPIMSQDKVKPCAQRIWDEVKGRGLSC